MIIFSGFPQYLLFRSLGHCLSVAEPEQPLQVLNEVWKFISKLSQPAHYISCAEVWVHFIATHFSVSLFCIFNRNGFFLNCNIFLSYLKMLVLVISDIVNVIVKMDSSVFVLKLTDYQD